MERFQHALPWRGGLRRPPAQASDRGRSEGDAEKMDDGAIRAGRPKDSAALHLNLRGHHLTLLGIIGKRPLRPGIERMKVVLMSSSERSASGPGGGASAAAVRRSASAF